jgi:primosomal protein N' (replication factor Y)
MECYRHLLSEKDGVILSKLQKDLGFGLSVIRGLESKGIVSIEDEEDLRISPAESMALFGEGWDDLTPGEKQVEVLEEIGGAIKEKVKRTFLIHGVSGSGKTVIYIEAIKKVLEAGRSAILLVPEIVLTPQTVSRLRQAIDEPVALFHSALSEGERYDTWRKVRSGDYRVVVGARSAVFSPVENLGLIVIDEEHEMSYKQEESPRYHAREVALERAGRTGSVVILGSATPSLESYWKARRGTYSYMEMPHRYLSRPVPKISIVDMRKEQRWKGSWFISEVLGKKLTERQQRGEQSILFLNRRGHSTFLQCLLCGWVAKCRQCDISITYHRSGNSLVCHYCNETESVHDYCPSCQGNKLRLRGLGTEKVEEEIRNSFPGIRITRMDMDSTSTKGAHQRILEKLLRGETDVLLGTQMVTKGLDFPGITLVGVISSDISLHIPDLRSAERTYQLLAQVAGRSGREGGGGEVVLQTFIPDNRILQAVKRLDYTGFVGEELRERSETSYPPYFSLTNVMAVGRRRERVVDVIHRAAGMLSESIKDHAEQDGAFVVGPAPGIVERIRNEYRWHLLFKMRTDVDPEPYIRELKEKIRNMVGRDVQLFIDRDPVSFI